MTDWKRQATRAEAEKAIRAVIAEAHASYVLKHEVKPDKALDQSVAALLDQLVWPVLVRLGVAVCRLGVAVCYGPDTPGLEPPTEPDLGRMCGCGHRAGGHAFPGDAPDGGPCRWCPCPTFNTAQAPETARQP